MKKKTAQKNKKISTTSGKKTLLKVNSKAPPKHKSKLSKRPTRYLNVKVSTFVAETNRGEYPVIDEVQRDDDKWTTEMQESYVRNEVLLNGDSGPLTGCTLYDPPPGISPHVIYLEDGLQRQTALVAALDDPEKYRLSEEDVDSLKHANVCIRVIDHKDIETAVDHFDAMEDNRAKLTTNELFSPYLRIVESALPRERKYEKNSTVAATLGTQLYQKIGEALNGVEKAFVVSTAKSAAEETKADIIRNGIALFELFETGRDMPARFFTGSRAKKETSRRRVKAMQTEYRLGQLMQDNKWTQSDVDVRIKKFKIKLAALLTEIADKIDSLPGPYRITERKMERVVFRTLIGVGLYLLTASKNSVHAFDLFLDWYFDAFRAGNMWSGRLVETRILRKGELPRPELRMRANNVVDFLNKAIAHWGCPDILNLPGRPKSEAPRGFHVSHEKAFSTGGTETVIEPARKNLSRGKNKMSAAERARLTRDN